MKSHYCSMIMTSFGSCVFSGPSPPKNKHTWWCSCHFPLKPTNMGFPKQSRPIWCPTQLSPLAPLRTLPMLPWNLKFATLLVALKRPMEAWARVLCARKRRSPVKAPIVAWPYGISGDSEAGPLCNIRTWPSKEFRLDVWCSGANLGHDSPTK